MDESTPAVAPAATTDQTHVLTAAREDAALWQARAAYLQDQANSASQANADLQEQVLTLDAQLHALEAYAADLEIRLAQAESALDAARMMADASRNPTQPVPPPPVIDIIESLPRSPDESNQYARRTLGQIRYLVLHHSGSDDLTTTPQQMAEYHVKDAQRQWPGIGFHYFVAADGAIYQTNHLETVCFHVPGNNAATAGIVLVGNFSGASPTPAQMTSTAALLAWLLQELRLPAESICGHVDMAAHETDCPGADWPAWKGDLLQQVRQMSALPRRPIYHYVLFAPSAGGWADWQAAARYLARFQPTAGFSPQEAAHAENVTIIGGVSAEVEAMLRGAGCRVQRITGKNATQLRSLLDTMAKEGHRFLVSPR
jgi:hypothetical protein